jgi:hypothetical protein
MFVGVGGGAARAQALKEKVLASARDSSTYDAVTQTAFLYGEASVSYGDVTLKADRIRYDFKNEEAEAFGTLDSTGAPVGQPQFIQGGHTIGADTIRYNFRSTKAFISEVRTTESQLFALAHLSKLQPNQEVHSKGGMLTTCDRPHPHYHFAVSRMMVIPDDQIITGPAIMKLGKVPVPLAVPFGFYPNKQNGAAGVLIPVWGASEQLGTFLLNGGFYTPLSEHADLSVTGDIYSKGSWGLRARSNYRTRYRYSGNLELSRNTLLNGIPETPGYSRQDNFFVRWNHTVDPRATVNDRFSASVNFGSSQNFTNTLNSSNLDYLSNTFQSNVQWSHVFPRSPFTTAVAMRHSQNSETGIYDFTLPALTLNMQRIYPALLLRSPTAVGPQWTERIGVSYALNFDNRLTVAEDQLYLGNGSYLRSRMRNGIRHSGAVNTSLKAGPFSINPELAFQDRMYFKYITKTYDPGADTLITDTLPGFRNLFDWRLGATVTTKLYGMYQFRGAGLRAIRHVITPSATVSYQPDFSTEITGPYGTNGATGSYSPYDIGIYGKPPSAASGLLNLGLIQSVEAKVRDGKAFREGKQATKKVRIIDFFGLNSSYDWMRDSLNWSPINASARTSLFDKININLNGVWDTYGTNTQGQRIEASAAETSGRWARLTFANIATGFEFRSGKYGVTAGAAPNDQQVVEETDPTRGAETDFNLPWRLAVNHTITVSRTWFAAEFLEATQQSILFNGDITVLKHWKLGFNSGYDIENGDWTPTTLNLYWDLHCWEFNASWIPNGFRQSISVRVNVKASILKDLKVDQRVPVGGGGGSILR